MGAIRLYLASASPRRLELLRQIGLCPTPLPASVDESPRQEETPRALVLRLAQAKGRAIAPGLAARPRGVILAADTAVVIDDETLGKPSGTAEAESMLRRLRGHTHEVLTGVFLVRTDDARSFGAVETTRVHFRDYDDATIRSYVAGGEPLDKAGAYAIQGDGARLVDGIDGSWSNVVGLPMERLPQWMLRVGVVLEDMVGG